MRFADVRFPLNTWDKWPGVTPSACARLTKSNGAALSFSLRVIFTQVSGA
jgi:hypothetical protein